MAQEVKVQHPYDEIEILFQVSDNGHKIFSKFGRNPDVDGPEDIWNGGSDYTGFPTSAAEEFEVFSSSAADTAAGTGAQEVRIYYYDEQYRLFDKRGIVNFVTVELNGTTPVPTGVSGMRILFIKVTRSGSGTTNAGTITCRWTSTTDAVFAVMPIGFSQTAVSNFTVPAGYQAYIKRYSSSILDAQTNRSEIALRSREFNSNTWRNLRTFIVSTDNDVNRELYGGILLFEKSDFIMRALSVANSNADITCSYALLLRKLDSDDVLLV